MKSTFLAMLAGIAFASTPSVLAQPDAAVPAVLSYHGGPDRRGNYIVPALTWERARSLRRDTEFQARIDGHLYAQPLYWREPGSAAAILIVATENNVVEALDTATGREVWNRSLGRPATRRQLPCGDIDPLGVTGTPVIDAATKAIYLDAMVEQPSGPRHLVFALSLHDGSLLSGWPVDVADGLSRQHIDFRPSDQNQRGALAILDGTLYVPFGGHFGDCGAYHGIVAGIPLSDPGAVRGWATRGPGGGIWAPGGIASDGKSLLVATGNTIDVESWSDGEAVLRLAPDLRHSSERRDFFAPANWSVLDEEDADLGGTGPLPLEVGGRPFVLALGKDGKAYLLDGNNLGGIGGSLNAEGVAMGPIIKAPAAYPAPDGVFVVFAGRGSRCPPQRSGAGLIALKIRAGAPPAMATAWCASVRGRGSPIVTTTDGRSDPIVWTLGAEGDDRLHAFKGDTGEPLVESSAPMSGLRHFQTLIATADRLYVAADDTVYAFRF